MLGIVLQSLEEKVCVFYAILLALVSMSSSIRSISYPRPRDFIIHERNFDIHERNFPIDEYVSSAQIPDQTFQEPSLDVIDPNLKSDIYKLGALGHSCAPLCTHCSTPQGERLNKVRKPAKLTDNGGRHVDRSFKLSFPGNLVVHRAEARTPKLVIQLA